MVTGFDEAEGNFIFNSIYFTSPDCVKDYLVGSGQFNLIELNELYHRATLVAGPSAARCGSSSVQTCEFHGGELGSTPVSVLHEAEVRVFCDKPCAKSFFTYGGHSGRLLELELLGGKEGLPVDTPIRPHNRTLRYFRTEGTGYSEADFLATLFLPDASTGAVLYSGSPTSLPFNFRDVSPELTHSTTGDSLLLAPFGTPEPGFRSEYI